MSAAPTAAATDAPVGTESELSDAELERYARHVVLPEIGDAGQRALLRARVLVVGAGGLGAPALLYLAAAGIGTLGVVDDDRVELSNLQRQVLFGVADIGRSKVAAAADRLGALDPALTIVPHAVRLTAETALGLIGGYDLVVDGSDNFATRWLVHDACFFAGRTLVSAAIHRFHGQLATFRAHRREGTACLRCVFGPQPGDGRDSCADVGVLGALPGVMGALQATEVVKEVLGIGESLAGRLLLYEALDARVHVQRTRPDPDCPLCGPAPRIRRLTDVDYRCGQICAT